MTSYEKLAKKIERTVCSKIGGLLVVTLRKARKEVFKDRKGLEKFIQLHLDRIDNEMATKSD